MTTSRTTAVRCLALAQLRLTATDDQSLSDAAAYARKALDAIEDVRAPGHDPVAVALGRALKAKGDG